MRYIQISKPGEADVLQLAETDVPNIGPGQVLIKVRAAGVNRPDIMQRLGKYPPPPGASHIPGLEVAGDVIDTASDVDSVKTGDAVCALLAGGGYAEYAVADAPLCLPVPAGLNYALAAAIPENFYTVWSNIVDRAGLQAGETILIHGGSSGIGTAAIQISKALGATVFTTAGSAEKCHACTELGADLAINYKAADFVHEIKTATAGKGTHVIVDMVLGDYMQKNMDVAAIEGRIVIIAGQNGYVNEINLLPIMMKRLLVTGSTLRARERAFKADIAKKLRQHVWPWLESGQVKPIIYQELELAEAATAHKLMETSTHIGKIILKVC